MAERWWWSRSAALRWIPQSATWPVLSFDDVMWSVVTAVESVALVSMLCFFFLFCDLVLLHIGSLEMLAAEIAKLYENLSLVDEDGAIHELPMEEQKKGEADVGHCLVGKILTGKKVNMEAFTSLIEQLWSPFGSVAIESVGENIFMFYFSNQEDRN
ncbi:hypothetical protein Dsin_023303 [Dipteronia sinensis]|uniref:DUF4283 domain-containing protein n=1 Tax=Dipteronia sinensis TaxID=43782 RepID=A0AAE0A312_9ROSI|nr:hypothetical protein Dsin_023303 [Dipteronia sinensis]